MKSPLALKSQQSLIDLSRSLTPQERLDAFYHHSQLVIQLSLAGKKKRLNLSKSSANKR